MQETSRNLEAQLPNHTLADILILCKGPSREKSFPVSFHTSLFYFRKEGFGKVVLLVTKVDENGEGCKGTCHLLEEQLHFIFLD